MQRPSLESRLADWCLQHRLAQSFSYRAVEILRAIERGDADVDPAEAHQLLQLALKAIVTHEVLSTREASR